MIADSNTRRFMGARRPARNIRPGPRLPGPRRWRRPDWLQYKPFPRPSKAPCATYQQRVSKSSISLSEMSPSCRTTTHLRAAQLCYASPSARIRSKPSVPYLRPDVVEDLVELADFILESVDFERHLFAIILEGPDCRLLLSAECFRASGVWIGSPRKRSLE